MKGQRGGCRGWWTRVLAGCSSTGRTAPLKQLPGSHAPRPCHVTSPPYDGLCGGDSSGKGPSTKHLRDLPLLIPMSQTSSAPDRDTKIKLKMCIFSSFVNRRRWLEAFYFLLILETKCKAAIKVSLPVKHGFHKGPDLSRLAM